MTFLTRTTSNCSSGRNEQEHVVNEKLIPALFNRDAPDEKLREVQSLSVERGGLALNQPDDYYQSYQHSLLLSQPLDSAEPDIAALQQDQIKKDIKKERSAIEAEKIRSLIQNLDDEDKHTLNLVTERGASAWLNTLPLEKHGFWLNKADFRDVLCLRYDWEVKNITSKIACGSPFVLSHALHCPKGGFPMIHHNEVRDVLANLMRRIAHDVKVEPHLQPLDIESPKSLPVQRNTLD